MNLLPHVGSFLYLLVCLMIFMPKKTKDKIGFLKDDPINDPRNLKYGHSETVDALENIIKNNHNVTPITIGLFGDWGSGKSSLVESLQ